MTLPAQPRPSQLAQWRGGELPADEGARRIARVTAALSVTRRGAVAAAAVSLVVQRTADLAAEDFDAGVDWLLDFADEVVNPIPAIRRVAAGKAKDRRDAADAERSTPRPHEGPAVPCPPEIREKWRRLGSLPPEATPRDQRLRGLRQLATVLGATKGTDKRDTPHAETAS